MKRLIILLFLVGALTAAAQSGLNVNKLFDGRFHDDSRVAETLLRGDMLRDYKLDIYRSLSVGDTPEIIAEMEGAVKRDGATALDREVSYRDGGLYYAFYELKPLRRSIHRYLFYINRLRSGGDKAILIYLEGNASKDMIMKMLK